MSPRHVIVVGGGITGLSAAWQIQQRDPGTRVTLIESSERLGGKILTECIDAAEGAYRCEAGAESFVTRKPELWELATELGLAAELERTSDAQGMYIWRDGAPVEVPLSPLAFFRSPILSWRGKLRLLREPFVPSIAQGTEETLAGFVTRRLGREALDGLIGPIIGGIYNADPETQSIELAMPYLSELERRHGGILKGMLRRAPTAAADGRPRGAVRFRRGASVLIDALRDQLRCDIQLNTAIQAVDKAPAAGYLVHTNRELAHADGIIFATPTPVTAALLTSIAPSAATRLSQIAYQPIGTAVLTYSQADAQLPSAIMGLIVPRGEGRAVDAVLFASNKQPNCAPEGHVVLRVFFGGTAPGLMDLPEDALLAKIQSELAHLLSISRPPAHSRVQRWRHGFVRAPVGHLAAVAAIRRALPPDIEVAGASYDGVGVPDCIRQGRACADRILAWPNAREP